MPVLSSPDLLAYLHEQGLVDDPSAAEIASLEGGVSSEIRVVTTPGRRFAVKQALEKLRVKDDWRCDPARNLYEQEYLAEAQRILPGSVPSILHCDRKLGLFVMEYLDGRWTTWKSRLWAGEISHEAAAAAGHSLGVLHRETWARDGLARRFDNTPLFHELRLSPYLLTTAERHPELAPHFEGEVRRLSETRLALVHGDYSPKNLLTDGARVKIIDAEVAWFGDPAFDLAFLSNHLFLKAVRFPERAEGYSALRGTFLAAYRSALGPRWNEDLESRSAHLTLLLMMARISGKSPAEYLSAGSTGAAFVLRFAAPLIAAGPSRLGFAALGRRFHHALSHEHLAH